MNLRAEAAECYLRAQKLGRREQRQRVQLGQYPYLQVLDELLADSATAGEVDLGLLEIPTEKIVGTRSSARTNAFAANFMPLLPEDSEFAIKWCKLCEAHLSDEGIRDAVICYEYLGRFYVAEGNKRVSVLKFFGATAIPAQVRRILPAASAGAEWEAYSDFLTYYPLTKLYEVCFTRPGSFPKLQAALGYEPEHCWTKEERRAFLSAFFYFRRAFQKLGGETLRATASDALLEWLKLYPFEELLTLSDSHLLKSLEAIWADIKSIGQENVIEVSTESAHEARGFISRRTLSMMPS
ncbi:MAG: BMP family ABC transporter substrate-binding protein, partial [Oscillospiraceae bacterium]|nr:BMP family ABC transporter substrate-binding protein [Oscillospiraceae bacterium]